MNWTEDVRHEGIIGVDLNKAYDRDIIYYTTTDILVQRRLAFLLLLEYDRPPLLFDFPGVGAKY
jgi:hypothetical protein